MALTNKDINSIKTNIWWILETIFSSEFNYSKYIDLNLITPQQCKEITDYTREHYYSITLEPLPTILQPIIEIAKHMVEDKKQLYKPKKKIRTYYTSMYDKYYSEDNIF